MGVPISGLPWGYGSRAPDSASHARSLKIYLSGGAGTPQSVHPDCPEASATQAFASPASFTATIGV
ncbi:hypothetical protein QFZ22_004165 [Streptomyces canus]|uniref:Uncharacterized protein n=1 Tax=Streptomyces canus TaxID=58343 RepID=A0AAW8FGA9_9ACTN|nr:hypothetical protein [Streptomyces canus]